VAAFPRKEAEIAKLASQMVTGLTDLVTDFPTPPVPSATLQALLNEFEKSSAEARAADAAALAAHKAKNEAQKALVSAMKADLQYGEAVTRAVPLKLQALGWGPKRTRHELEAPGEVVDISMPAQGRDWVKLEWKTPLVGGHVAAYRIERRKAGGPWEIVATATETQYVLERQPRGVDLDFQVRAINKAGEGHASGVLSAVL